MDALRRTFLKAGLMLPAAAAVPGLAEAAQCAENSGISLILPRQAPITFGKGYPKRLAQATYDYVATQYRGKSLPVWKQRFDDVDLAPRLDSIAQWVVRSVAEHAAIHYVDPVWVMAQTMAESVFYEFAISSSLALGVAQFILPTAKEYGFRCAGEQPEHLAAPYRLTENASAGKRFYELRNEKSAYKSQNKDKLLTLEPLIANLAAGRIQGLQQAAARHQALIQEFEAFDSRIAEARGLFSEYLMENLRGRSVLNPKDLAFIESFDGRFSHRIAMSNMVKYLARLLLSRNGNVLAAAASYNAGPGRTEDEGFYGEYGRIPALEETTKYVSHIVVNHYEISRRMAETA